MATWQLFLLLFKRSTFVFLGIPILFAQLPVNSTLRGLPGNGMPIQWKLFTTTNVEVWYPSNAPELGKRTAQMAEQALSEYLKSLDYQFKGKIILEVFAQPHAQWVSPGYQSFQSLPQGGVTRFGLNIRQISYSGSQQLLWKEVRKEVAGALINEIYFENSLSFAVQQQLLQDIPDWFSTGIPNYLATPWNAEDEARMKSLAARKYLSFAQFSEPDEINQTLHKSIWYFVQEKFGADKIYSIMYMTRVSRSVQSGVITVLGISLETFTERWREFYVQRYLLDEKGRKNLSKETKEIQALPSRYRLVEACLHPSGDKVAAIGEHLGRYHVFITPLSGGKPRKIPIHGGHLTWYLPPGSQNVPMSWNKKGTELVVALPTLNGQKLFYWNSAIKSPKPQDLPVGIDRINSIQGSDQGKLLLSASHLGQTDLYVYSKESGIDRITNDLYDETDPIWSKDENSIFFASSRIPKDPFTSVVSQRDIFRYDLKPDTIAQITATLGIEEKPLYQTTSFELVYLSDESGLGSLLKRNIFLPDSQYLGNFDLGIRKAELSGNRILFQTWNNGKRTLYWTENNVLTKPAKIKYTLWGQQRRDITLKSLPLDSIPTPPVEPETEDTLAPAPTLIPKDSIKPAAPVKFYLFDEEDSPVDTTFSKQTPGNQPITYTNVSPPEKILYPTVQRWDAWEVKSPKGKLRNTQGLVQELRNQMGFDPYFRYYVHLGAQFTDIHKHHLLDLNWTPYFNYRNSDLRVSYQYTRRKIQPGVSFRRSIRFFNREDTQVRYNFQRYDAWVSSVIIPQLTVSGGVTQTFLWRNDVSLPGSPINYTDESRIPGLMTQVEFQFTQEKENFRKRGIYAIATWQPFFIQQGDKTNPMTIFSADLRKYTTVFKEMVFATRLTGGFGTGSNKPLILLGGIDNWLNGRVQNAGEIPAPMPAQGLWFMQFRSPVRGFPYNARNGTQFLAFNGELRIPLLKYLQKGLAGGPLYNFQLVLFYDMGTVWTTGNPFSQKNPVNTLTVDKNPFIITVQTLKSPFIIGTGGGFRMAIMRYIVKLDMAFGFEDGSRTKPQFSLALGKDF